MADQKLSAIAAAGGLATTIEPADLLYLSRGSSDLAVSGTVLRDTEYGCVWVRNPNGTSISFRATADTDAARGIAIELAFAAMTTGCTMNIGPGTYNLTAHTHEMLLNNVRFIGSGMDLTTLKYPASVGERGVCFDPLPTYRITRGIEIAHLTLDCNGDNRPGASTAGAYLFGGDHWIHHLRVRNWSSVAGSENFILLIISTTDGAEVGGPNPGGPFYNNRIEDCIIEAPSMATSHTGTSLITVTHNASGTSETSINCLHGGAIRRNICRGIVEGAGAGQFVFCNLFTLACYGGEVESNRAIECIATSPSIYGYFQDTYSSKRQKIHDNDWSTLPFLISVPTATHILSDIEIYGNLIGGRFDFVGNTTVNAARTLIRDNITSDRIIFGLADKITVRNNVVNYTGTASGGVAPTHGPCTNVIQHGNRNWTGTVMGAPTKLTAAEVP